MVDKRTINKKFIDGRSGENCHLAKLTEEDVLAIYRRHYTEGESRAAIARSYAGLAGYQAISNVINGTSWRHLWPRHLKQGERVRAMKRVRRDSTWDFINALALDDDPPLHMPRIIDMFPTNNNGVDMAKIETDYDKLSVSALRKLARENGLDPAATMTKVALIDMLLGGVPEEEPEDNARNSINWAAIIDALTTLAKVSGEEEARVFPYAGKAVHITIADMEEV